ncbi:MerR family transcriptional regulator [Streptosporangium sp. NBC_01756]|uniref:MerR family transcriptional regulator n=1 Tax=Streptosporangium sp. NBC_01756 TaxID=2975950 RepID=UPI002DD7E6C2|nr:MerR family transcriptional regulator [Streptosporangium sp. NBC_01756]WSC84018.1 MerR family transcriptional regulator [Streptosporangium sp. NBC_01756]
MDGQGQVTTEEEPGYGIGAVARRLGVPAPTLRTWNLRYGIGPSHRSPGGHRRYDAGDLRRLEEMSRLIKTGVPAADAAREALRADVVLVGERVRDRQPAAALGDPVEAVLPDAAPVVWHEIPSVAMLGRAAFSLDSRTVSDWIGSSLTRHGVLWTWENLVVPVFDLICRRQAETGASIEIEHLFSERVLTALTRLIERPQQPVNERPVLLACAEEEQHSLPIYALAAELTTEYQVETRILGARTPYSALADAMRRLGPAVVFIWSQVHATGDPAPLASLPLLRPASRVIVGGQGWWDGLPPSVSHVTSFREALTRISGALH